MLPGVGALMPRPRRMYPSLGIDTFTMWSFGAQRIAREFPRERHEERR